VWKANCRLPRHHERQAFTIPRGRRIFNAHSLFFPQLTIGVSATENSTLKCTSCGKIFTAPMGNRREAIATLVEEESARCNRLRELKQQREALGARIQAGFAGMLGSDRIDTNDLVAHRQSLAQLEAALRTESEELAKVMLHVPEGT